MGFTNRDLDRLISAFNMSRRRYRQNQLINNQDNLSKTMPPHYEISEFDFNEQSRVCHIFFTETKKYRRIERYITQNYVKHPIYSDWITKKKVIRKTVKLSNEVLENLNQNDDFLIREFATEIIEKINNQDLVPSWFLNILIDQNKENDLKNNTNEFEEFKNKKEKEIEKINSEIDNVNNQIIEAKDLNVKLNDKKTKKINKIKKIKSKKYNIFKSIFSFGLLSQKNSERKINKLSNKVDILKKTIANSEKQLDKLKQTKKTHEEEVVNFNKSILKKCKEKDAKQKEISDKYDKEFSNVKKLMTQINIDNDFVPLKQFAGIKYEKIIGCYIIHNKELNKYYVGQSKDVIKRINRDHFNGTMVKNIIFAEDYFKSKLEDKSKLFEVKVIKLNTKDEMDRTEKELIEQYDSFNNGYNGTNGNK